MLDTEGLRGLWLPDLSDPMDFEQGEERITIQSKQRDTFTWVQRAKSQRKKGNPPQAHLTTENPEYLEEPELLIEQTRTTRGQQYEEIVEVE